MATWPSPPPTRILNWRQMCTEADPYYQQDVTRPWWFEFSNRRRFLQVANFYANPAYTEFVLDTSTLGGPDVLG